MNAIPASPRTLLLRDSLITNNSACRVTQTLTIAVLIAFKFEISAITNRQAVNLVYFIIQQTHCRRREKVLDKELNCAEQPGHQHDEQ